MVIISNPRRFSPLMAESSFKRKIVGAAARALKASKFMYTKAAVDLILILVCKVPVIRPQDLATKGKGQLLVNKDSLITLNGKDTQFKTQAAPKDTIVLSKSLSFVITEVVSDTELRLKTELTPEAIEHISNSTAFKIIPHVDQGVLYEKVHERLNQNESIVIFPEGGSHDRSEMLPLKGKVVSSF